MATTSNLGLQQGVFNLTLCTCTIFVTSRVCFQSSLPDGVLIKIEAMLYSGEDECKSMHVQSVSHWAPANIGPYSQAYVVGTENLAYGNFVIVNTTGLKHGVCSWSDWACSFCDGLSQ